MNKVFFKTLHTRPYYPNDRDVLISVGLAAETGETFYGEIGNIENGISKKSFRSVESLLKFDRGGKGWNNCGTQFANTKMATTETYGSIGFIISCATEWLNGYGNCMLITDVFANSITFANYLHACSLQLANYVFSKTDMFYAFEMAGIEYNEENLLKLAADVIDNDEIKTPLYRAKLFREAYKILLELKV